MEWKTSVIGNNSKLDIAEEKTSELEDTVIECIQSEREKTEKKMKITPVSSRTISNGLAYV